MIMEPKIEIEIVEVRQIADETERLRYEEESAKLLAEGADFIEVALTTKAEEAVPGINATLRRLYDQIKEDGVYIYEMNGHRIFVSKDRKNRRIGGATREDCVKQFGEDVLIEWEKNIQ
jgi:hypothetical protein